MAIFSNINSNGSVSKKDSPPREGAPYELDFGSGRERARKIIKAVQVRSTNRRKNK